MKWLVNDDKIQDLVLSYVDCFDDILFISLSPKYLNIKHYKMYTHRFFLPEIQWYRPLYYPVTAPALNFVSLAL